MINPNFMRLPYILEQAINVRIKRIGRKIL